MSNIVIERIHQDHICTLGKIIIAGNLEGFSIEPPWKHNQKNVSCIPQGIYKYEKYYSEKFNRLCLSLYDVPERNYISIHPGNYPEKTKGCILPCSMFNIPNNHGLDSGITLDRVLYMSHETGFITIKGGF